MKVSIFLLFLPSSMCEINLEAELFTLQDSNAKLVAALQEANSSVEQWKKQLAEYQEETDRLRDQVTVQTVCTEWLFTVQFSVSQYQKPVNRDVSISSQVWWFSLFIFQHQHQKLVSET